QKQYQFTFLFLEIFFTLIFLIEYILRLISVPRPMRYATSFFGIIDLASVLPTLLALLFPQLHFLMLIRMVRLLRVFRIFGMTHFMGESATLIRALWRSRTKIMVFFFTVFIITSVTGVIMY